MAPINIPQSTAASIYISQQFKSHLPSKNAKVVLVGVTTTQTQYASNVIPLLNYIAHLRS